MFWEVMQMWKKITEGRKLSTCSILLTSRPHSVEEIEKYFPTCIGIHGFSRDHARYFVSNCIQNQGTVQMVLSYSVKNVGPNFSLMLLSFLCILVNSNELDLNKQYVPLSEVYYKLILCVYRKYCERMKKEFKESEFIDVLTRVGKFALKMWKSCKNWAKRSEVIKEVGGDAFEIGLLIGHKDSRLLGKVKADILITFPHFALQEFIGSFGFLQMLNEGESIDYLWVNDHGQKILHNPCFIQFCLWFTKGCSVWENFRFPEGQNIYESVVSECAKEINFEQLDMFAPGTLYPFLQVPFNKSETSTTVVKFIKAVLSKCDKIKEFHLPLFSYHPTDFLCELLPCFMKHRKSVIILDRTLNHRALRKVLDCCYAKGLTICLLLVCDINVDLSQVMHISLEILSLLGHPKIVSTMAITDNIVCYPSLTALSLINVNIHPHVLCALHAAVKSNKLPLLSRLSLEGSRFLKGDTLHLLFASTWPSLTHLNLKGCILGMNDYETLGHCLESKNNSKVDIIGFHHEKHLSHVIAIFA